MKRLMTFFMILACWALLVCPQVIAAEAPKPAVQAAPKVLVSKEEVRGEVKMVTKTLSGEVSAVGASGLALVYAIDSKSAASMEMWFPFESEIKLSGYKSKKEIKEGDLISVTYEEALDKSGRRLTGVTFKGKKPVPVQEELPEEEEPEEAEEAVKP